LLLMLPAPFVQWRQGAERESQLSTVDTVTASDRLRATMTVEQCWQRVPGGSGTYIRELAREYAGMSDVDVTGLSAWHREPGAAGLPIPVRRAPLPRAVLYEAWQRTRLPRAGSGPDVVHATTWAVPGTRAPLVVTVHDLAFRSDPGHFTPRGVRFFERGLAVTRAEAAAVIVPSEVTRRDCLAAGLPEDRLHVVPHGVRPAKPVSAECIQAFRRENGLTRPYVLWVGTREPRKNLPTLVAAFGRVVAAGADLDLVLVGPDGWGPEGDRAPGAAHERVRFLGHLLATDLAVAYAGAAVFCYPSSREGFGMPVTEAMAHGIPVVTSRGTATEEAAGSAALLVDPRDEAELAGALQRALEDDEQARLRAASTRRAAELSWSVAARRTLDVLRSAAGGGRR
jgi:glycosyltransferase involved in cell wall biosynthesis